VLAQAACLGAALCYAIASVWGRRFRRLGVPPLATAFGMLAASTVMMLPLVVLVDRPWAAPAPGWGPVLAVVALALLSTALAYQIYFRLLARAGAVNLALVTFLIPVSAIGLAVLVLGESLVLRHVIGMGLIALGLLVIDGRLQRVSHRPA
jgi:drug/metabolite transporter (DMT)-like permease